MSIDGVGSDADADDVDVDDLGRRLGEAITTLPEYREYEAAKAAVENSASLQEQISEFEQLRQEFQLARQTGEATQSDVEAVKRAQAELHDNPEMARYLEAQETLRDRLEAVNEAISEPLSVDFGGEAGGCCND